MRNAALLQRKTTETYAVRDGDNPIATLIECVLKDVKRKQFILDTGDPRECIERIKKKITVRKVGTGPTSGWMYMAYLAPFDVHFRIMSNSRLAEDLRYNPF